jgi:hypothetical protein
VFSKAGLAEASRASGGVRSRPHYLAAETCYQRQRKFRAVAAIPFSVILRSVLSSSDNLEIIIKCNYEGQKSQCERCLELKTRVAGLTARGETKDSNNTPQSDLASGKRRQPVALVRSSCNTWGRSHSRRRHLRQIWPYGRLSISAAVCNCCFHPQSRSRKGIHNNIPCCLGARAHS